MDLGAVGGSLPYIMYLHMDILYRVYYELKKLSVGLIAESMEQRTSLSEFRSSIHVQG